MYKFTGFTQKANDVLNAAIEYAENMGHTYIGSEHLLLGLLTQNGGIAYTVLINKKLTAGKVEDAVRNSIGFGVPTVLTPGDFTPRCKNIIESAMIQARDMGHNYVGTEHLLIAMIKEGSSAATAVMTRLGVSPQEILQELLKAFGSASGKDFGKPETVKKPGGRTDTPTLNQYGRDLTSFAAAGRIDPVIGRQKEIERVIQILSRRTKNNPCLIGEPGVGKTAIAEGLALKIATDEVPELLKGKRIVSLDLTGMVAGTKYRGDFEERVKSAIEEVSKTGGCHSFYRRIAYAYRCRLGGGCGRRREYFEARACPRRDAGHRCNHARRIPQAYRKGRRARAPFPARHGRRAERGRGGRDTHGHPRQI